MEPVRHRKFLTHSRIPELETLEVRVWAAVEAVSDLFSDGFGGKIEITAEKNRRNCRRKRDAIADYRDRYGEFSTIYELLAVPGIYHELLEEFEEYICVEDSE